MEGERSLSLELLDSAWSRVLGYLCVHELLGVVAALGAPFAAALAEEGSWSTLALPRGPQRLDRLLALMLSEERALWVPLLHRVQVLDLDLQGAGARAVGLLRDLLLHGLSVEGALRSARVRRVPVLPAPEPPRGCEPPRAWSKKDLALVNPVSSTAPAKHPLFLLDPAELGQLRFLMAQFRHFRLRPAERVAEAAVELVAERGEARGPAPVEGGKDPAYEQADAELGAMRGLLCHWGREEGRVDFEGWLHALLPRYRLLLASWE